MRRKLSQSSKKLLTKMEARLSTVVLILAVLMGIQFLNNVRLSWQLSTVAQGNQSMIDEVGQMLQNMNTLGNDLNEVREFLLLPTHEYNTTLLTAGGETEEATDAETETSSEDIVVELFTTIETLGQETERAAKVTSSQAAVEAYMNDETNLSRFESKGLFLRNGIDHHLADESGIVYVTVHVTEEGNIEMTTYGGATASFSAEAPAEDFKEYFETWLETGLEGEREQLEQTGAARSTVYNRLTTDESVVAALTAKGVSVSPERETTYHFAYDLLRKDGVALASVVVDKGTAQVWIETPDDPSFGLDVPYDQLGAVEFLDITDEEPFQLAMLEVIEALDSQTEAEKNLAELRATLEGLEQDEGFNALLDQYGFTLEFTPTETETAWEYALTTGDGTVLRILYLDKSTGQLMIREEGAETGSLLGSPSENTASTGEASGLPEGFNFTALAPLGDNEFNLLIAGKHGSNTDTLMIANLDATNQKATLISIPRDLYYNGRKINSVYASYGMGELTREIATITGLKIDKYMLVDMYVFIDLIDMVGGIDVTLEEALIDPTYKTYENGMASTLYYPAGEHHLGGTEALRIARSRHTTSDYSRAERQQLIMMGLKEKIKELGVTDAGTVASMIQTTLDKTETNISLDEALAYYLRYQNFDVQSGGVMSTGNVLASVKLPVNFVTSLRIDSCTESTLADGTCQIQYAVYTLSPVDNNWDAIKWYVRNQLAD